MKHSPSLEVRSIQSRRLGGGAATVLLPLLLVACSSGPIADLGRSGAYPPAGAAPDTPRTSSAATEQAAAALRSASVPAAQQVPDEPRSAAAERTPPDLVPRVERIPQRPPNLPYVVRGDAYEPYASDVPMVETGLASWYGEPFHGRRTATGEVYDMNAMTAAHRTMPLPSYAVVRNRRNGKQVVVRVNDRGPYKYKGRVIDLSRAAARKLGFTGLADVEVRRLTHADIRAGTWKLPRQQRFASADPTR